MSTHSEFLDELEKSGNGHFTLEESSGRAILRVFPPGPDGRPVRLPEILARLELYNLHDVDRIEIEDIVQDADGKEYDIGEWKTPDPVDAKIEVEIDEDKMSATISIKPPLHKGAEASEERIRAALKEAGVVYGVDENILRSLLENSNSEITGPRDKILSAGARRIRRMVLARGRPPIEGKHGAIKHRFNPNPRTRPKIIPGERNQERVDFKSLNVIQTCVEGDLLAEIADSVPGEIGFNVLGEEIPAGEIRGAALHEGKNTRLSSDARSLYAAIAGQVRIIERQDLNAARIEVEEVLQLEAVDYSTGHIEFPGTVSIQGTVLDGFQVKAQGDIIIERSVGAVQLKAGGDIILSGGVVSRGQASIQAGGDIYAKFAQVAALHARGNVFIEEVAMHARIVAGQDLIVEGGRGEIIGGNSLCGRLLRARKIGARNETETLVTVGVSPEIMEELERWEEEYNEKRGTMDKVNIHLSQIEEARKRGKEYEENQDETYEKLTLIRDKYQKLLIALDEQRETIYANIKPGKEACVESQEGMYPGVEISFGAGVQRYKIDQRPLHSYCRFILEENRIILRHSDLL